MTLSVAIISGSWLTFFKSYPFKRDSTWTILNSYREFRGHGEMPLLEPPSASFLDLQIPLPLPGKKKLQTPAPRSLVKIQGLPLKTEMAQVAKGARFWRGQKEDRKG